uniref:Cystatin domain-containing protein n=1 Tax=Sinocyclocheilus rhinocerous TaxID=307959 RepID=A0A673KM40_9TELE
AAKYVRARMLLILFILTDLVIDTSIIEHSEWCTPIDGSGIKIATLPDNLFRAYYALLLRQRRDAKDDKWPKLLKLEKAKTQAIRGGKEYVFMMIFGDSNCTKPQGEAGAKCTIMEPLIQPLIMSNPYRCVFKVVDYSWESRLLFTSSCFAESNGP